MNFGELILSNSMADWGGGEEPDNPIARELRILAKRNLPFDNRSVLDISRSAAKHSGINPALLLSSAFQEGMNKAVVRPDEVSQAYVDHIKGDDEKNFPVDGFYNYGLDTFGQRFTDLKSKGYLPQDWDDKRFKAFEAMNEKKEKIMTSAFRTNEDALIAKAAILRDEMDAVKNYATQKGIQLDDDSLNYFTLASYNSGLPNAQKMLDKYSTASDKKKFITKGDENWQKVHKNIQPRLENYSVANELLNEKL